MGWKHFASIGFAAAALVTGLVSTSERLTD